MEAIILEAVKNVLDAKTFLILVGLYVIYRKIGVVECGVRAGLLSHITRIHAATTKNNYISKDTLQIVMECYKQYKNLGGDGYADHLMAEIDELSAKSDKETKCEKSDKETK